MEVNDQVPFWPAEVYLRQRDYPFNLLSEVKEITLSIGV